MNVDVEQIKKMPLHERTNYLFEEFINTSEKLDTMSNDFNNYRRNKEIEIERMKDIAAKNTIITFLDYYDNLYRVHSFKQDDETITLLLRSFQRSLKHAGATLYCEIGDKFNPDLHEAYSVVNKPNMKSGRVAEILRQGCILNGEIIRHALVSVSQ